MIATNGSKASPIIEVKDLVVHFRTRAKQVVHAVNGISFHVDPGETLALVGESGSGKSTIGMAVLRRIQPTAGTVWFDGVDITNLRGRELRSLRRDMQVVLQDPYSSLSARMRVGELVGEPLIVHGVAERGPELRDRVGELLELCGLSRPAMRRYPHAFSGGERQRIAIARALALNPRLIVADEPVSSLDVSVQGQIINLLAKLQSQSGLAYIFISHNLAVVRQLAHRVLVLYAGRIMEYSAAETIFRASRHPYTQALLSASPVADPKVERSRERVLLRGDPPSVLEMPRGCPFSSRCPSAVERCFVEEPPLEEKTPGQWAACWLT